jgi:hypothetical protein
VGKKCLIAYSSLSGNTEKVAVRFKSTFEKHGWQCDMFKVGKKPDLKNLPFRFKDYDFACVGSGLRMHGPYENILSVVRKDFFGVDMSARGGRREEEPPPIFGDEPPVMHRKIVLGGDAKKAIVFVTYSGFEFGPGEAVPALELLALEIEHLEFKCIGKFCCPGRFLNLNSPTPRTYHGDIRGRPDERDLLKAEMFIEEKLEEIADRTA